MEEGFLSATKHESILKYIESLAVGTKISVRKIAKAMDVSEGTAYRAIKEAENIGLVSTRERIGTVRVERKRSNIDKLTFAEVVNIVDGDVLGGKSGLTKTLSKFVIGAMEIDAMVKYIEAGSLLIVGNREQAHARALEEGAGVLITGGFGASPAIRKLADELGLPLISSSYDTFTVASLINRAIYDRLIKKKIMLVEDLMRPDARHYSLKATHTVRDWEKLLEETEHSRFPVVDEWNRVIGMVTAKDVLHGDPDQPIEKFMTKTPLTVTPQTSVASAAHLMVWEGIELLPVVDAKGKLISAISRQDVLKALQYSQKQPQIGETFEDLIMAEFEEERDENGAVQYRGVVTPRMTNRLGTASEGVLTTLMAQAAYGALGHVRKSDLVLETMSSYFLRPLQIDSEIIVKPRVMEAGRKFGKADVEIYSQGSLAAKSILAAQVIDHG
ncbi:DRTGG domain-containing protein [Paenibacillus thermoaerophilus]|uniref:DRTGG domain-containing protein n=1 Tax=Paenibacillus thermoaerophilus TaxID=1215385 RepID=A0ABW2V2N2_9BACL|nr:DRTGG domain-containing protein [Paenibacillus thermoaerophilus]TMV16020.1 CBS domain-containing protein [Paenibacillus thermoaerophilus]